MFAKLSSAMIDDIREIARKAFLASDSDFDAFESAFAASSELKQGSPEYHRDFQVAFTFWQYWIDHEVANPSLVSIDGEPFFV